MLAVGIIVLTLGYALTYVGVERVRGDLRTVTYMVMGKDAPQWNGGPAVHVLAN